MKGKKLLEFLRYCLDDTLPVPESSRNKNWMRMMDWAEGQSIVGVIYGGIQKSGKALNIPFDDLMEWIDYAQDIENHNKLLNKKCVEVVKEFQEAGFDCLVLKGQGNAMMYPNPLLRNPGDIDLLVLGHTGITDITDNTDNKTNTNCTNNTNRETNTNLTNDTNRTSSGRNLRKEIERYVREKKTVTGHHCYHIEYEEDDIPIEIHYYACNMNNPIYRRRLQKWFKGHKDSTDLTDLPDGVGKIPVPTWEFNIVFQLAHMMHHFFDEGIGLRQMIDYYYLLKTNTNRTNNTNIKDTLRYLGLEKFAGAVMYIMKEVPGLDEKCLIVPVDERRGKTLLQEIMEGGNFGRSEGRWKMSEGRGKKYFVKIWRNLHFVREYPAEALCEPIFRTWHFFWRVVH